MSDSRLHRRRAARGFSLIELLLAIFILGVGVVAIAAVFPAGIIQQRRAQDDILGPVVAEAALSTLRTKLSQDDFGTFEEFGIGPQQLTQWTATGPNPLGRNMDQLDVATGPGDWPWIRPSMCVRDDFSPISLDDRTPYGAIDIFSSRYLRGLFGFPGGDWPSESITTEFITDGGSFGSNGIKGVFYSSENPYEQVVGVPFNRRRFGFNLDNSEVEPRVTFSQEERCWPAGSGFKLPPEWQSGDPRVVPPKPQYVWDCMFRRFQGRVQVAIFVYRVIPGSGGVYAPVKEKEVEAPIPPLPARLDLPLRGALGGYQPLTPAGDEVYGPEFVPDTTPELNTNDQVLDPMWAGWQAPGQWLLDPTGRIHRVVQGRRNKTQGPVRLARPIPAQSATSVVVNPQLVQDQDDWVQKASEVRSLWFIPPADRRGVSFEPVYVTVREL